jgi:TRAP-type transport system small permease protein
MQTFVKIADGLNAIVKVLLAIFTGLMAIIIISQVFSRFLFDNSLSWSEELARYFSIYAVFFGAAIAMRYQNLIAVEVLHEFIPAALSKWLKVLVNLICIFFFALLFLKGIEMVNHVQAQMSPALQIPMSIPYASIPIGAVLLIINTIVVIIELLKGVNNK